MRSGWERAVALGVTMFLGLGAGRAAQAQAPLPAAAPAASQAGMPPLTLERALRLALDNNLLLQAKQRELDAVRANEVTAGLLPNPQMTPSVTTYPSPTIYEVQIAQTIELGGKRQRRLESAQAGTRAAAYDVEDARRQVALQVRLAFAAILLAQAVADQTRENLGALDQVLRLQRLRAATGDLSELDLLRIQQARFQLESDAADAMQNLALAKINLRTQVGPEQLPPGFEVSGAFALPEVSLSREELYARARQNRADIRSAQATLEKAQDDYRLAQANAVPDIQPTLGYVWSPDTSGTGSLVGVSLPLPLFNRNQGEIQRTAQEAERGRLLRDTAIIQALSDVDVAISTLRNAQVKLAALRDQYLPQAREIRDRSELAYRQGGASLLDYLDAQREFRAISLTYLNSQGGYDAAYYQLEAAIGGSLQ